MTETGINQLARALSGYTLTFTRACIGDGILPTGQDPEKRTSMIAPKMNLPIKSIRKTQDLGTCELVLEMNNQSLTQGFFINEYGIFARLDNEAEFLYAYKNTGANLQFLPPFNNVDPIDVLISVILVISRAQNVNAVINIQNNYVTLATLEGKILGLFSGPLKTNGFWTWNADGEKVLRPQTLDEVKKLLLGGANIPDLTARIERLEDNLAEVLLSLEVQKLFPGYSHYIIEDFQDINQIDLFECNITSIKTGNDTITCELVDGIIPGSWYTISDGAENESVKIKSVNIQDGVQYLTLDQAVNKSFNLTNARLYRTTCAIENFSATGPAVKQSLNWTPLLTWSGRSESTSYEISMNTTPANSSSFILTDNAAINSEGYITLGGV